MFAFGCADPPDDEQMPQVYDECFRRYGVRRPFWSRFGAQVIDDAGHMIEERAAYARFGL